MTAKETTALVSTTIKDPAIQVGVDVCVTAENIISIRVNRELKLLEAQRDIKRAALREIKAACKAKNEILMKDWTQRALSKKSEPLKKINAAIAAINGNKNVQFEWVADFRDTRVSARQVGGYGGGMPFNSFQFSLSAAESQQKKEIEALESDINAVSLDIVAIEREIANVERRKLAATADFTEELLKQSSAGRDILAGTSKIAGITFEGDTKVLDVAKPATKKKAKKIVKKTAKKK